MQLKIFDIDGNFLRNIKNFKINRISEMSENTIQIFDSIDGLLRNYIRVQSHLGYCFTIGIINDIIIDGENIFIKFSHISTELKQGYGFFGSPNLVENLQSAMINTIQNYSLPGYPLIRKHLISSIQGVAPVDNQFTTQNSEDTYIRFLNLEKQLTDNWVFTYLYPNTGIDTTIHAKQVSKTWDLEYKKLYSGVYVDQLRYSLSAQKLINYVAYRYNVNSTGYVSNANINTLGAKSVYYTEQYTEPSSASLIQKAESILKQNDQPKVIIKELSVKFTSSSQIKIGDKVIIKSDLLLKDYDYNNIVKDVIYNASKNNYTLILGEIIDRRTITDLNKLK